MALAALVSGCATPRSPAPVEDRNVMARPMPAPAPAPAPVAIVPDPVKIPPGSENAGKPGYYTIKPGDTMIRIGLETGQNWKDLVKWNNLDNPNVIEVGQVLRVVPPGADPGVTARPVAPAKIETRPLDSRPVAGAASAASTVAGAAPAPTASAPAPVTPAPVAREGDDDVNWQWPATGSVLSAFEEGKAKGLTIAGKAGDPVMAAAEGRVVYAGSGLRGYGNLVILKHNNTYLTAYAHNQALLVKEDQNVRRGQKIAEMGSTDAERVQLHFEIRRQGKPVDPAKLLPPR
jgi:lipoprotein NlpD